MLENAAGVVNGPSGDISPGAATRRATGLPLNVKMAYNEPAFGNPGCIGFDRGVSA